MNNNHDIDEELHLISKTLSFTDLKPLNVDSERKRFFSEPGYNPMFTYGLPSFDIEKVTARLASLEPEDNAVGAILAKIRDNYLMDAALVKNRGKKEFSEISLRLHGQPTNKLVRKAKKLLYLKINKEVPEYTTKDIINKLKLAFVKYGFHWKVEERDMVANAAVQLETKRLFIKKNSRFSASFLRRIIVHDIGTHVIRSENGLSQPYKFFARGFPGYLKTEEGLAVYNEERNNCLNNFVLKVYAGRVLAVEQALKGSFGDTFKSLSRYFTKNTAWRLTLRAKRGISDTSKPGAFTKDIAYLMGYYSIKDFVENGGDINKLYYGKIGIDDIDKLDSIPGLINPKVLPMFRYMKYFSEHFDNALESLAFRDGLEPVRLSGLELY